MTEVETRIEEARQVLRDLGFDRERTNDRSCLVLLALLALSCDADWSESANPLLGTRAIMDWIRDEYHIDYAPNSRETLRRFTLHQFVDALLVERNPDQPSRPVNSPANVYQVRRDALEVIREYNHPSYRVKLEDYLAEAPGLMELYRSSRAMARIPVTLPNGEPLTLSPGGQNVLIKQMVDDFCQYFTPGGQVLYIGDADAKWALFQESVFADLGITIDQHGKMPDLVVYMPDRQWLVLMEAASSHGPVDAKRYGELATIFANTSARLVYVSCFPDRRVMRKYLADIAWETEVWCADNPTHMIHFNGERFLKTI